MRVGTVNRLPGEHALKNRQTRVCRQMGSMDDTAGALMGGPSSRGGTHEGGGRPAIRLLGFAGAATAHDPENSPEGQMVQKASQRARPGCGAGAGEGAGSGSLGVIT